MPRKPRLQLAGWPQHVVQRGNDRKPTFRDDADRLLYLRALQEMAQRYACDIHAYVLMSNHVHLLVTPRVGGGLSRCMQQVGRRYVRHFNERYERTGTLWEGRFRSCLVGEREYLLNCYRYIEMNPVRAGMVATPAAWRWSSHRCNALAETDTRVTPHPDYLELGETPETRLRAYGCLFSEALQKESTEQLRHATEKSLVYGDPATLERIETLLGRSLGTGRPGRPRKPEHQP